MGRPPHVLPFNVRKLKLADMPDTLRDIEKFVPFALVDFKNRPQFAIVSWDRLCEAMNDSGTLGDAYHHLGRLLTPPRLTEAEISAQLEEVRLQARQEVDAIQAAQLAAADGASDKQQKPEPTGLLDLEPDSQWQEDEEAEAEIVQAWKDLGERVRRQIPDDVLAKPKPEAGSGSKKKRGGRRT